MTRDFENMLYLFGANTNKAECNVYREIDPEKIRKYAMEQGVWTMVYPELSKICDVKKYQGEFFMMISSSVIRKEFTLGILKKLEASGIKCCLLKGASVSPYYADPECRISSDADILINPDDEEKVKGFLRENGYEVEGRKENHHHLAAFHKVGGLLEVHVSLYSKTSKKILFNDYEMLNEPWISMEIDGAKYNILGINDNLMYLTAHYIKHLVNSGGGVRQMMDLLLFIEKNKEKIDFEQYYRTLKDLNYGKLIDVVKSVGAKYFGFDYEIKEEALMNKVLTDTEEGGIFGHSADNRSDFFAEYCKRRASMPRAGTAIYMLTKHESGPKLFPSQDKLVEAYGYKYAKHKVLLPVAWVHRYIDVLLGTRKPEIEAKDTAEFIERMQLMYDLGMINKE